MRLENNKVDEEVGQKSNGVSSTEVIKNTEEETKGIEGFMRLMII